jgi:geranylgeranyl transferase type-2 subunit alpha
LHAIDEKVRKEEHEFVQNAFYTDPSDQSGWFYHKWLLGRDAGDPMLGVVLVPHNEGSCPSINISLNWPFKSSSNRPITIIVDDNPPVHFPESDWPQVMWSCDLTTPLEPDSTIKITIGEVTIPISLINSGAKEVWLTKELDELFKTCRMTASSDVLSSELAVCRELLTLEPNNKWCLLTTLQLLEGIDYQENYGEILELFERLIMADPLREGYYRDLRSCHVIRNILKRELEKENKSSLDLSDQHLTKLYFSQHMMLFEAIDLSNNSLSIGNSLEGLQNAINVRRLSLDNNQLDMIPIDIIKQLKYLKNLSLKNNKIDNVEELMKLKELPQLEELEMDGNSVCELGDWEGVVKSSLNLTLLDGQKID